MCSYPAEAPAETPRGRWCYLWGAHDTRTFNTEVLKMQKSSQVQRLVQIIIIIIIIGDACLSPVFLFYFYIIQKQPKEIHSADLIQHFLFHLLKTANMTRCKIDLPALINGTTAPDCKLFQPDRSMQ